MRKGLTEDAVVIADILKEADVIWLALTDEDGPHCVPVNFAHEGNVIYIHTGQRGRKAACLDSGKRVAFSAAVDVRMRKGGDDACAQGYLFRSVMGSGLPRKVEGEEKMRGLDLLSAKHLETMLPYDEKLISITMVYAIDIDTATARVKG